MSFCLTIRFLHRQDETSHGPVGVPTPLADSRVNGPVFGGPFIKACLGPDTHPQHVPRAVARAQGRSGWLDPSAFHMVAVCLLAARFRQEHAGCLSRGQQPQELHLPILRGGCPTEFSLQVRRGPPPRTPVTASVSLRERDQACAPQGHSILGYNRRPGSADTRAVRTAVQAA